MIQQNRREFLKHAACIGAGTFILPTIGCNESAAKSASASGPKVLKGFIVSDAHVGWENAQQPSLDTQAEMMRRIMARFPDLDVFIDTGDAHHNGRDRDTERGQWTDLFAGGCKTLPFYYVPGNHEIVHCGDQDREMSCCEMGSMSTRPYYSFDIKNIHFVSMPELVRAVYITKETLEWVALDLEVNKDKTTILLSHNNIRGTTQDQGEDGYRGLVNSKELMALMDKYPNVVAWMHGHNHTYEIVKTHGKLFVSNGRIGGFDPVNWPGEMGAGNLGGIYFELTPDRVQVKCYSAEKEKFLDELGLNATFTDALNTKTSLNPAAPSAYSFGYGGARDGQKMPVYFHHTAQNPSWDLFLGGAPDAVINDDPEIKLWMARKGTQWQLMGSSISGNNSSYDWLNPGVRINAKDNDSDTTRMTITRSGHHRTVYYRCPPGRKYQAAVDLDAAEGGQTFALEFMVHDRSGKPLTSFKSPEWTLAPGKARRTFTVDIPEFPGEKTIYSDAQSDNIINLSLEAAFSRLKAPVIVRSVTIAFADAEGKTVNPGIRYGGRTFAHNGALSENQVAHVRLKPAQQMRDVFEITADGNRRTSWLLRQNNLDWQVRNAAVADKGTRLEIGPLRNTWTHRKEIVIVPLAAMPAPYVHRLRNIAGAQVYPLNRGNRTLDITVKKIETPAGEIDILTDRKPKAVTGADSWTHTGDLLTLKVGKPGTVSLTFA